MSHHPINPAIAESDGWIPYLPLIILVQLISPERAPAKHGCHINMIEQGNTLGTSESVPRFPTEWIHVASERAQVLDFVQKSLL